MQHGNGWWIIQEQMKSSTKTDDFLCSRILAQTTILSPHLNSSAMVDFLSQLIASECAWNQEEKRIYTVRRLVWPVKSQRFPGASAVQFECVSAKDARHKEITREENTLLAVKSKDRSINERNCCIS
jgi:hypothetical protein